MKNKKFKSIVNCTYNNIRIEITKLLNSEKEIKKFLKANKILLQYIYEISISLLNYEIISMACLVCSYSPFVKTNRAQKCNLLIIAPKGSGKSTLSKILAFANRKFFLELPKKPFESLLLKKGSNYFNLKVLLHSDLITCLFGLTLKQRQQLLSFFTELLSDGFYSRDSESISAECAVIFGIASENFEVHRAELVNLTFLERVMPITKKITRAEEVENLEKSSDNPLIKIKLKFPNKPKKIDSNFTNEEITKINRYSLELKDLGIMSSIRAKNWIILFCQSNALLNGRNEVCKYDLTVFEIIYPLIKNSCGSPNKITFLQSILKKYPNAKDTELMKLTGWSRATFYKYKKLVDTLCNIPEEKEGEK
ncbi:hypothetical protein KJ671_04055 [Patescibacteria group bacterium]|nr:hypothetical protein [Patescibacteria group bacterium]